MAICSTCRSYYRLSPYNDTDQCDNCVDTIDVSLSLFDEEDSLEVEHLLNPTGKTAAKFSDE